MPFAATWIDLETVILGQKEKDKCHMISLICRIYDTNEFTYRTEIDSQTQKISLWLPKGKAGLGINQEVGINYYTLLNIKQITNEDLLYSTANYIQYLKITCMGK